MSEPGDVEPYAEDCAALGRLRAAGWSPRCVYDVGASNGAWTSCIVRLWPDAEYHLFEPLAEAPEYAEGLAWMAGREDVDVTVHGVALDATESRSVIGVSVDPVGSSLLVDTTSEVFPRVVPVEAVTLDGYRGARGLPAPQLLKLDTQGLELRILQGARRTLREVEVVLAETWVRPGYGPATPLLADVVALLAEHGLAVIDFAGEYRDEHGTLFAKDLLFARGELGG